MAINLLPVVTSNAPATGGSGSGSVTTPSTNPVLASYTSKINATQGWYITIAIVVSTMLANTPAGPLLLGIMGVALIWQVDQLLIPKVTL